MSSADYFQNQLFRKNLSEISSECHNRLDPDQAQRFVVPGLEVIKLVSCSAQLSMKFILLINVKMPKIVGILTFISRINTTSECFKQEICVIFQYFTFYDQLKFHAQLS